MDISIVKAGIKDLDTLMEWRIRVVREVFDEFDESMRDDLYAKNMEYYQKEIPNEGHIACLAYDGDTVIGCGGVCLYEEMPSPDNRNGKCAYLMNIYVASDRRREGVGNKIVNWLISQAREYGANKIYLETSDSGEPMYRAIGFDDMKNYMRLS